MEIPRMIHFFGPDGAGKSTQVDILLKFFNRQDPRVKKCWLRSPHTLAFLLWRILVKIGFYRTIYNAFGYGIKLPAVNRNRVLRKSWALIELFSVLPWIIRIRFSMFRGHKCVAERYILDTVTTVAYFIDDINFLRSGIARLLYLFIPVDTVFIFLDSDFKTIFERRAPAYGIRNSSRTRGYGAVPEAGVEPRSFIDFQRTAYKALSKSFNALELDTARNSIQETTNSILEYLSAASRIHEIDDSSIS